MNPQIKLLKQIFDLKKATDYTLTNKDNGKWTLNANDGDKNIVFTMTLTEVEVGQLLIFLAQIPKPTVTTNETIPAIVETF